MKAAEDNENKEEEQEEEEQEGDDYDDICSVANPRPLRKSPLMIPSMVVVRWSQVLTSGFSTATGAKVGRKVKPALFHWVNSEASAQVFRVKPTLFLSS